MQKNENKKGSPKGAQLLIEGGRRKF